MLDESATELGAKEKFELAIQSDLQLIPGRIGAAISNIYFGRKQEKGLRE